MKIIKFYDIEWDTEFLDLEREALANGLPNECELEVEDSFDVEFQGDALLLDEFGFIVNSFKSVEAAPITVERLLNIKMNKQVKDIKN